jgi:hypothetical protein
VGADDDNALRAREPIPETEHPEGLSRKSTETDQRRLSWKRIRHERSDRQRRIHCIDMGWNCK